MQTKLRKLEKVQFLVEELLRQAELYDLTLILTLSDKEEEKYRQAACGNVSELIRQLGHTIVGIGEQVKDHIEGVDTVFTELMKLSIENIKEKTNERPH